MKFLKKNTEAEIYFMPYIYKNSEVKKEKVIRLGFELGIRTQDSNNIIKLGANLE